VADTISDTSGAGTSTAIVLRGDLIAKKGENTNGGNASANNSAGSSGKVVIMKKKPCFLLLNTLLIYSQVSWKNKSIPSYFC